MCPKQDFSSENCEDYTIFLILQLVVTVFTLNSASNGVASLALFYAIKADRSDDLSAFQQIK